MAHIQRQLVRIRIFTSKTMKEFVIQIASIPAPSRFRAFSQELARKASKISSPSLPIWIERSKNPSKVDP